MDTAIPTATETTVPLPTATETASPEPTLEPTVEPTTEATPEPTTSGWIDKYGSVKLAALVKPGIMNQDTTPQETLQVTPEETIQATQQATQQENPQSNIITVTLDDSDGNPAEGVKVYAFRPGGEGEDAWIYTGFSATTDSNGQAALTLAMGSYRFRADVSWTDGSRSTQFWSNADALCTLPDCGSVEIKITRQVTITVSDTDDAAAADLPVYAFSGGAYTGYTSRTDANGQVRMILPEGAYRFRSDLNSTQFWSSADDACAVLSDTSGGAVTCDSAAVTVTKPMTVTVLDSNGSPMADLPVYAFNGETYSGYTARTDVNGQASLTLPLGSYRFRSDLGTTHFWTASDIACEIPGCESGEIRTTLPVTITVKGKAGNPYPDLPVHAFSVAQPDPASGLTEPVITYTGYNSKTDADGKVTLTLPVGDYRFRSDYDGVQFWSDTETACSVLSTTTPETPGCQAAEVILPGGTGKINVTIDYEYDDLNRITSATYSDGNSFTYEYDPAGNVEEFVSVISSQTVTTTYHYNAANELVSATRNNVVWVYEYDGNGALLSTQPESGLASGSKKYTYNTAGYLTKVEAYTGSAWYTQAEMSYTGLGERLSMTGSTEDGQSVSTTYALSNGSILLANASGKVTAYLYGNGTIGEQTDTWNYALIDGTGTPRQMVDESAKVTAIASYTPWGDVLNSGGTGAFSTGMMGGILDATTGLIYVGNGQYFDPETGRFLTRGNQRSEGTNPYTPWKGDPTQALVSPLLLLALLYTRRKNRNKFDKLLVVLVLLSAVGLSLSAYTPVQADALPASSGGGVDAPSMPMGYASTAEAGTSSGVAAGNPGGAVESPTADNACGLPSWDQISSFISEQFTAMFSAVGQSYAGGWENYKTAWSIYWNPNATYWQRLGAKFYMDAWGGAHVGIAVGVILLGVAAWEAYAATVITAGTGGAVGTANTACGGDMCASEAQGLSQEAEILLPEAENIASRALTTGGTALSETLATGEAAASKAITSINTGSNVVYRYVEKGVVKYIGITNNFARRAAEHWSEHQWRIEKIPGLDSLSRYDARSIEQVLIGNVGLPDLYNKINSIAATNPIYPAAIKNGTTILQMLGLLK